MTHSFKRAILNVLAVASLWLTGTAYAYWPQDTEPRAALEVPQLFAERVKMADVPLVAKELGFDDGQTEILRQLFLDYLMEMEAQRARFIDEITSLKRPNPREDPDYRARQEHRKEIKRIRSSRPGREAAQGIRRELDSMSSREVSNSRRHGLIRSWQSVQAQAYENLLENMQSILESSQPGHWSAIERSLRRRNTPWKPLFTPEGVNLSALVYSKWGRDSDEVADAYDALVAYDMEYDQALQRRDEIMARTEPVRLDARDFMRPERMISTRQDQVDARVALWMVNNSHIDRIAAAIGGESGADFKVMAMSSLYPDIYEAHRFENAVEYAMQYADLPQEQYQSIVGLLEEFAAVQQPLNEQRRRMFCVAEPERYMRGEEDNAMLRCYQTMDSGIGSMDEIREMNRLNDLMKDLDKRSRAQLRELVGASEYDSWPAYAARPKTGDVARGPVPDADPDMPVVYLSNMKDSPVVQGAGD